MRISLICAVLLASPAAWPASGLTYSTYLRKGFAPSAVAVDPAGNLYLAGAAGAAAMVLKLDPSGARYLYARTFGGSVSDAALGIAVDSAGNAYVTGTTSSPDFPVTPGGQTGTLPAANETRAFLAKFDPQGEMLFSAVLGNVSTTGLATAVTSAGQILVSGVSVAGLASSPGAYHVADTRGRPFLMEVDATGSHAVFTASGIGGGALALDGAGNIYMAGSTVYTDYPTTQGAYQGSFSSVFICSFPCNFGFPGVNQYVTKVDASAAKLIYSTGVTGSSQTVNHGLAVDSSGNVYVTGLAYGSYPWTVGSPNTALVQPFLTKLDAAGANALYSIPIGGAGVALGSQGDVYVGGSYNDVPAEGILSGTPLPGPPQGVGGLPTPCATNNITTFSESYVSRVDALSGAVSGTVLVDGSNVSTAGIAFAGSSSVWLAGSTSQADVPITPGAAVPASLAPGTLPGAYLGEANFALPQLAAAQIACIVDAGNQARAGVVAPNQLLALLGTGLGPAGGMAATDTATTSLGGVTVSFNGAPAPLLYVSPSQINVAVPPGVLLQNGSGPQAFATMQVMANGVAAAPRQLPLTASNPSLFADLPGAATSCTANGVTYFGAFTALAMNADGSVNSCSHPAQAGTVISLFVNGMGVDGITSPWLPSAIPVAVQIGRWSAEVRNVLAQTPFVWQVDVVIPEAAAQAHESLAGVTMDMNFQDGIMPVGPIAVQSSAPSYTTPGTALTLNVWIAGS